MSEALSSVGAAGISALGSREIDSQNMRQVANLLISVLMEVQRSRIDTAYQDAANQLDSQNLARALSALSDGEESSKFRNYVEELIDLLGADANLLSAFKSVSGDSQEFQTLARRADGVEKPEEHGGDYFVRNAMNAESREEFNNESAKAAANILNQALGTDIQYDYRGENVTSSVNLANQAVGDALTLQNDKASQILRKLDDLCNLLATSLKGDAASSQAAYTVEH